MYWFYNLFRVHGGRYIHIDTEDKDTPVLRLSLTGYDIEAGQRTPCTSMDAFQRIVDESVDWFKATCAKGGKDALGRRIPLAVGIDSLTAKMTESAQEKMSKEGGAAGRRFADEARSLSDWFKYVPNLLKGWPIGLLAVGHDKPAPSTTMPGVTNHNVPGGYAPKFYATYRIMVTKWGRNKQSATGWEGNKIRMEMDKSSLGGDKLKLDVDFSWRTRKAANAAGTGFTTIQESLWNFDKATTELLYNMSDRSKGSARANAVEDLVGLTRHTGGRFSSKPLGVSSDEPLGAAAMGRVIDSNTALLCELEPILGIHPGIEYDDNVDFQEQLVAARAMASSLMPSASEFDPDKIQSEEGVEGESDGE